jgi:hypothetical protein
MNFLHDLLNKQLTRKEFLIHVGMIALAVIGFTKLSASLKTFASEKAEQGYGSGKYGE